VIRYHVGDAREVLATLPAGSVDLVMTSPPFLAVRSYLPADHPDKGKEMGGEPDPGAWVDRMLDATEACRRVLAPHGSLCVELGDCYAGGGAASDGRGSPEGMRDSTFSGANSQSGSGTGWPLNKSLALVPELYRIALAYGRNPLTGRETPRWRVRNVVRWHRPNPPVGALGDKFRPATTDMVVACVSARRYFDLDAVREPTGENTHARLAKGAEPRPNFGKSADRPGTNFASLPVMDSVGAPPLDTWIIPTAPYKGSHYATFPEALCIRPVKAMCPERVCTTCGEPSRRVVGEPVYVRRDGVKSDGDEAWRSGRGGETIGMGALAPESLTRSVATLGWTDCGHDTWRRGVVLDPFAGTGTVGIVAETHGRDAVLIDLDARNVELARQRCGWALEVAS